MKGYYYMRKGPDLFYVTPESTARSHGGGYREADFRSIPTSHSVAEMAGAVRVLAP